MFCPKCGNQIKDNAKFCAKCGAPIKTASNEKSQAEKAQSAGFGATHAQAASGFEQAQAGPKTTLGQSPAQTPKSMSAQMPMRGVSTQGDVPFPQTSQSNNQIYGTPTQFSHSPNNAAFIASPAQTSKPSSTNKNSRKTKIVVISVIVAIVVIAAIIIGVILNNNAQEAAKRARNAARHDVAIASIVATGYDANDSRLPVQVTGNDGNGDKVDEQQYIAYDGSGLSLPMGNYTITVLASPLTDDGTIYDGGTTTYTLNIPTTIEENDPYTSTASVIALAIVDAINVTDDQINKAAEYAKKDEKFDQTKVDAFTQTVINTRQAAIDQKAAAEAAAAAAAKAAADAASISEHYRAALTTLMNSRVTPDGKTLSIQSHYTTSDNKFAIEDVDQDGVDELIIQWTGCATANFTGLVYEYLPDSDSWVCEYSGTPGMTFFYNGYLREDYNHNQTYSNYWPCNIRQYQGGSYVKIHYVYGLDKSMAKSSEPYPTAIDTDNAGTVYNVDGQYVSQSTYNSTIGPLIDESNAITLNYHSLTSSAIASV